MFRALVHRLLIQMHNHLIKNQKEYNYDTIKSKQQTCGKKLERNCE